MKQHENDLKQSLDVLKETNRHKEAMKLAEIELSKVDEEGHENARQAINKSLSGNTPTSHLFGLRAIIMVPIIFVVLTWFLYILITDTQIPESIRQQVIPYIENGIWSILGFLIGSSTGSKIKGG